MDSLITQSSRLKAVPFTDVTIDDVFWTPRLRANRERTLPIAVSAVPGDRAH